VFVLRGGSVDHREHGVAGEGDEAARSADSVREWE
jgi:hypothetical protein